MYFLNLAWTRIAKDACSLEQFRSKYSAGIFYLAWYLYLSNKTVITIKLQQK